MKTRIIQTRFWDDLFVESSDIYTQHLYIYLLTSSYINISGIFQLTENKIKFECKLTDVQFKNAKQNLENNKKVFFKDGWVYVTNAEKNNGYRNSPKNEAAYERELSLIPKDIKEFFDSSMDSTIYSSIDSSIYTTHKPKIKNHKSKTINQKSEIKNNIKPITFNKREDMTKNVLQEIADKFEVPVEFVSECWDTAQNWLDANAKTKKNYKAFLSNWVKRDKADFILKNKRLNKGRGGTWDARTKS